MQDKIKKNKLYTCCKCNKNLDDSQFYKTYSKFYSGIEHLPMCKECFADIFEEYAHKYNSDRKAMQRICMAFDMFYDDAIYESCAEDQDKLISNYIRRLNMVQYKKKNFDATMENGFFDTSNTTGKMKKSVQNTKVQYFRGGNPEDVQRWGTGFDSTDYEILNSHYNLLKNANPNGDSNQEIFINDLCYTKMQQMKAVREGRVDDYNKLTESYRKSFTQAGLKAVRDSNINEEFTIGVNAETIEKYTPAEYYRNKGLYKDYDNIGEYIERFMLRPLRNIINGTTERDFEYYVKDDGDADDESDDS